MSIRLGLRLATGAQLLFGLIAATCAAAAWLFTDFAVLGGLVLTLAIVLLLDRSRSTPFSGK